MGKCNGQETEIRSLFPNKIWEVVESPPNWEIASSHWVLNGRYIDVNGIIEYYKARLLGQGCTQKFGHDFKEAFSPIVWLESIRFLLAIETQHKLQVHQ